MATKITSPSGPVRGLADLAKLDQMSAKQTLRQLATQINGQSGSLKLMHTTSQTKDMVFERKSWWQFFVRPSSKNEKTVEALRTLYDRAGLSETAKNQLEQYLGLKGRRLGGTELAKLVNVHLRSGTSEALMQRILPSEDGSMRDFMRSEILGTHAERHAPADGTEMSLAMIKANMAQKPDFNANYRISDGTSNSQQLVGISRSANGINQQFDLNAPIVLFFPGSHSSCDAYAYPAAEVAGTDSPVPLNFLAVDYRGFGQSSDVKPTPQTITEDAMKVYEHVKSLGFRPDQIILRGYSLGAAAAGRVHAHAELKGDKLGAVVYDRPMASAPKAAQVMGGKLGKWATQASVGKFGAARYLEKIPRTQVDGLQQMRSPVMVLVDSELEHGPAAKEMAEKQKLQFVDIGGKHDDHDRANNSFSLFVSNLYSNRPT